MKMRCLAAGMPLFRHERAGLLQCCAVLLMLLGMGEWASAQGGGREGPAKAGIPGYEFPGELRFAQYLIDKDAVPEAIHVLLQVDTASLSAGQKDSLFYMLGWAAYGARRLDLSADYLLRLSAGSEHFTKARFFAAYDRVYLGKRDSAAAVLGLLVVSDSTLSELRALQLGGIALLNRDYALFRQQQEHFTYSSYIFSKEEHRMQIYYDRLKGFRRRSPVLAGIYSAVVPGLGKFYAGKKKQGLAAFFPVMSLAALTYEAYRRDGVKSVRFIGFGALFSVFYIGNIWGSTLAVKIRQNEFNKEYDNKILFDMHIPLRNFFN